MKHLQDLKDLNGGVVSVISDMIFITLVDGRKVMVLAQKDVTGIPYVSIEVLKQKS